MQQHKEVTLSLLAVPLIGGLQGYLLPLLL